MSDFSVTAHCPVCHVRFAPDDGVACDCMRYQEEREQEARWDAEDIKREVEREEEDEEEEEEEEEE